MWFDQLQRELTGDYVNWQDKLQYIFLPCHLEVDIGNREIDQGKFPRELSKKIKVIKLFTHIDAKSGLSVGPFCGEYAEKPAGKPPVETNLCWNNLKIFFSFPTFRVIEIKF